MLVEEQFAASNGREFEFLRACLASQLFSRPLPDLPQELNWDRLYYLLKYHRLAEYFYVLCESQRDKWPASFRERLRLDRYSLMIYGDQYLSRIRPLLSALTERKIPVIVLKGWALIQTIYGRDASQRYCEDIDILVKPVDVDAVEQILKDMGCRGPKEIRQGYSRRYRNAMAYYEPLQMENSNVYFSVGLHWGLLYIPAYDPKQIDINVLFERARGLEVGGILVNELSPEDHILYTCAHLALHHYSDDALFRYYEIGAVIARESLALNWSQVIERACLWREIIPVRNILERTNGIFKGIIPANVLDALSKLQPALRERFVNAWVERTSNQPVYEHLLT